MQSFWTPLSPGKNEKVSVFLPLFAFFVKLLDATIYMLYIQYMTAREVIEKLKEAGITD